MAANGASTPKSRREELRERQAKEARQDKLLKRGLFGLLAVVLTAVIALVSVVAWKASHKPKVESAGDLTPKFLTTEGTYHITKDGGVDTTKSVTVSPKATRMELVFDPQCPACGIMDRALNATIMKNVADGKVDLWMMPVSFLDNASTDNYSTRATNSVITVAEQDPARFMAYVKAIYEHQPGEGAEYKSVSDQDLAKIAKDAGVSSAVADKFEQHLYSKWLQEYTAKAMTRTDLYPDGKFSTPGLFLGGEYKDGKVVNAVRQRYQSAATMATEFQQAVDAQRAKEGK